MDVLLRDRVFLSCTAVASLLLRGTVVVPELSEDPGLCHNSDSFTQELTCVETYALKRNVLLDSIVSSFTGTYVDDKQITWTDLIIETTNY